MSISKFKKLLSILPKNQYFSYIADIKTYFDYEKIVSLFQK